MASYHNRDLNSLKRTPSLARSLTNLALVLALLGASCSTSPARGHYTRGKTLFDKMAARDPDSWDFSKPIAEFSRAIRLQPDYVDAYHVRALAYLITGRYTRAMADLNKAINIQPKLALSYMLRGMAWAHLGSQFLAEADREKAGELGLKPLLRWMGSASVGTDPRYFGFGPVPATEKLIKRFDLNIDIALLNPPPVSYTHLTLPTILQV